MRAIAPANTIWFELDNSFKIRNGISCQLGQLVLEDFPKSSKYWYGYQNIANLPD
jgi:hypothetical protein